ncbi:MAG: DUF177 domain-containing protein [Afipia sp.]|nr:DUF177 domain-containing protein [Afipia sp.]
MTKSDIPWSHIVPVSQIPDTGLHQDIRPNESQSKALAALAGVRRVADARASLDLTTFADGRVHVSGRVTATVEQTCVVTLDPVENFIDEEIDVMFAPQSQIPAVAKVIAKEEGDDAEIPDPPEPIINGAVDLGQLATELLILGIDPYPRKPGAVFELPQEAVDPDEHPFAALKALKTVPKASKGQKPKKE